MSNSSDTPVRPHTLFTTDDNLRSPASGLHVDGVLRDFRLAVRHLSDYDLWRAQQKRKSQVGASSSSSSSSIDPSAAPATAAKSFGHSFVDYDEQLMEALNARGLSVYANEVRALSASLGDGNAEAAAAALESMSDAAAAGAASTPFMFLTMGKNVEQRIQRFWAIKSLNNIAELSMWLMNITLHSYDAWDDAIKSNVHPITIGIGGQHDFVHNVFLAFPEQMLVEEPLPQPGEFYNHPFVLATPQYPVYSLPSEYCGENGVKSSLEKEFTGVFVSNAFLFMMHWFNLLMLSQPLTAESPMEARRWASQQVRERVVNHLRQLKALKLRLLDAFDQKSNGHNMPSDLSPSYAVGVNALDNAFAHWLVSNILLQILCPFSMDRISSRAFQSIGSDNESELPLNYPLAMLLRGNWPVTVADPKAATAQDMAAFNANEVADVAWLARLIGCNYAIDFDVKTGTPISPDNYSSAVREMAGMNKDTITGNQKLGLIRYHCLSNLWVCMRDAMDVSASAIPYDLAKLMMYCMNTSSKPGVESGLSPTATSSSSSSTDDPEVPHVLVADTYQLGMTSAEMTLETSGKTVSVLETSPLFFLTSLSIKLVLSGGAIALNHYNCQTDESNFHQRVIYAMQQYAEHLGEVVYFGKFGLILRQALIAEFTTMRMRTDPNQRAAHIMEAGKSLLKLTDLDTSALDKQRDASQMLEFGQLLTNVFNVLPSEAQEQHEAKVFEFIDQLKSLIAFGAAHARPQDVAAVNPNNFIDLIDRFSGLGWLALETNLCTNWQETMKPNMVVFDNLHALFKARRDFDRFVASQCRSPEDLTNKTYCNMSIAQNYAMITERMSTARILITRILSSLQARWDAKFENKSIDILSLGLFYFDQFNTSAIYDPSYQHIFGFMELVASLNRLSRDIYYTCDRQMRLIEQFIHALQQMLAPLMAPNAAFQNGNFSIGAALSSGPAMFSEFMKCIDMFGGNGKMNVHLMYRVLNLVTRVLEGRIDTIMLKANAMLEHPMEESKLVNDMDTFKSGLHSALSMIRDFLSTMSYHMGGGSGSSQPRLAPEVFQEYEFSDDEDVLLEEDLLRDPNENADDDVIF